MQTTYFNHLNIQIYFQKIVAIKGFEEKPWILFATF